jgi:hypothetical protein
VPNLFFKVDKFTPKRFIEHTNQFTGVALGQLGYREKRTDLVFLAKLHNGRRHSQDFEPLERVSLEQHKKEKRRLWPEVDDDDNNDSNSESEIDNDKEQKMITK